MTWIILQVGNQPRIFEKIARVRMLQIMRSPLWRTSVSSHFNTYDLFTFFGMQFKELKDYKRPGHCVSDVYIFRPSAIFSVRWAQMWAGAGDEGPWLWRGCTLVRLWPLCADLALQSSVFVRLPQSFLQVSIYRCLGCFDELIMSKPASFQWLEDDV